MVGDKGVNGKMEKWIKLRDDDGDGGGGGNAIESLRFAFDLHRFDSCKQRLRSLFDQILVAFLRDKYGGKCHRPIPALCGDGRPVDLFKLFWLVRKFGGYDAVSRNKLWGFVSEECGLGRGVIASLKLIYMNYLNELDQWLQQVFSKRVLQDGHCEFIQKLDLLSQELELRFRDLSPDKQKQEQEQLEKVVKSTEEANDRAQIMIDGFASSDKNATVNEVNGFSRGRVLDDGGTSKCEDGGDTMVSVKKQIDTIINKILNCREPHTTTAVENGDGNFSAHENNGSCISAKKVVEKVTSRSPDHSEKVSDGEKRSSVQPAIDTMIPSKSDDGKVLSSLKRKRQFNDFSGMLSWLIEAAKRSNDPSVGLIPECSKWSDYGNGEFWAEALLVREALLTKRHTSKAAGEILKDQQKKARMLPSMYENDVINHQTTEKLRHSKRVPLTKSHLCPCCNSSAAPHTKDVIHRNTDVCRSRAPSQVVVPVVGEHTSNMNKHNPCDLPAEREVYVGPRYQAKVPQWTGMASDSDTKWLGTRMWPPKDGERNSIVSLDPIGKGRHHPCNCPFPDSVECVRFHIAEKRLKLKQELGSLFYHCRFNVMGEEVSLSWTKEDEKIFKDNMKSYAAFSNKFWNNAGKFLPSKTREELVSYYFNVYLVQRRSYQNRVTPNNVDSDDDEKDCGLIGGGLGYKAVYIPQSSSISCTLNTDSTRFV